MKDPLAPFLDASGNLAQMPRKAKLRALVHDRLIAHFEHGRPYTERQVNDVLLDHHTFGDPALLRRELFDAGLFTRPANGRTYHRLLTNLGPISLRVLTAQNDRETVAQALDWVSDYVKLETGSGPSSDDIDDFFGAPQEIAADNIFTLAILDAEGVNKGLMSALRDYPEPGLWFIGYLTIDIRARGQGYGKAALDWFTSEATKANASALRLCVIEENARGRTFWEDQGFTQIDETPPWTAGTKTHRRFVMERLL